MGMSPRLLRPSSTASAGPVVSGTDASILLRFNGTDQSTDFVDSSVNNWSVTGSEGAAISTDNSKFGGASLLTDSTPVYIAADPLLDLGSGDWTIELFHYQTGGAYLLAAQWDSGTAWFLSHNALYINGGGGLSWTAPDFEVWHHVAIVRKGDVLSGYVDGVMVSSTAFTGAVSASSGDIAVGGGPQPGITGFVDDFRLTKLAVYDGDFVPPSTTLSASVVPYTNYKPYGTLLFSECVDGDLVGTYADGAGERYTEIISEGACE